MAHAHNSGFSVAGMASSTSTHNAPSLNSFGTSSFGDSLSQPRTHYQPGYLMSASTASTSPGQTSQRANEVPIVATKAKINSSLLRGSVNAEFGKDSMFQNSRTRQTFADEDAPPRNSVYDIPNESQFNPGSSFQTFASGPRSNLTHPHPTPSAIPNAQPLYVVVFGYPPDKFSVTVDYFKALGDATEVDQNLEVTNCFRIGYRDPSDAMRAVRKNGEILGGSWMIGAKWADPSIAESLLGRSITMRNTVPGVPETSSSPSNAMVVDDLPPSTPTGNFGSFGATPSVGTPIRLAPSASAFRKPGDKPATPQPQKGPAPQSGWATPTEGTATPNKGVVGQVSDFIFGW